MAGQLVRHAPALTHGAFSFARAATRRSPAPGRADSLLAVEIAIHFVE